MKPDPPENVVARPVPSNPRRLEVTWQTPSTWPDPESFPLKFFLRYRPLILDQWQHVSALPGSREPESEPHGMGVLAAGCSSGTPESSRRGFLGWRVGLEGWMELRGGILIDRH